jgi:hypothetical protein
VKVLLRICAGLLLWALAFATLYGLQGLGCALQWPGHRIGPLGLLRTLLVVTWLGFLCGASVFAWRRVRGVAAGTIGRLEAGIAVVGAAAVAYTLFPVAWTSPCG